MLNSPGCIAALTHRWEDAMSSTLTQLTLLKFNILFASTIHLILRIVTENRIEWTACVANWKLCPEKPYTKPRGLPSIAAPICCSAVLGQMLVDLTRALDKLGIKYRLVYDTLLGAVRSQAIIPWTYDVDIAIPKSASKNQSTFAALRNELGGKYYVGKSFRGRARAHMLMPPYYEVNTAAFFDGYGGPAFS